MLKNWKRDLALLVLFILTLAVLQLTSNVLSGLRWSLPYVDADEVVLTNRCKRGIIVLDGDEQIAYALPNLTVRFALPEQLVLTTSDDSRFVANVDGLDVSGAVIGSDVIDFGRNSTIITCP